MSRKLDKLLESKEMSQQDLYREIKKIFPKSPVMQHQLSRIISGRVAHYSTHTVYRICKALDVTPNDILDF